MSKIAEINLIVLDMCVVGCTPHCKLVNTMFFALYTTRDKLSCVQIRQFWQLGSETGHKLCF